MGLISPNIPLPFRLRHEIQSSLTCSSMRSSRLAATSCSRFRSPSTISLDESLARSSAVAKVSTSRFPNLFLQDEEELETAEEEVEAPGPVLPHRRCRPIVVADH